jgi:hypothetical protein
VPAPFCARQVFALCCLMQCARLAAGLAELEAAGAAAAAEVPAAGMGVEQAAADVAAAGAAAASARQALRLLDLGLIIAG